MAAFSESFHLIPGNVWWSNSPNYYKVQTAVCSSMILLLLIPLFSLCSLFYNHLLKQTRVHNLKSFSKSCDNFNPSPVGNSEAVKKMIIKARQIYTLAKYHESCNFTQTQFSSTATPGKQPSLPLSRWRLGFWIMTSSKSCIWMSVLQCL